MSSSNFVLELADGSTIKVGKSPYSNNPVVKKSDVPSGRISAFTASNLPQGGKRQSVNRRRRKNQPA